MSRSIAIAAALAGVVVLAGAAGGYAYFFSGLRTAPAPLALSAATPTPAASASAAAAGGAPPVGAWTVAQGSQAGYRVREQFAGQSSTHDAVARTSSVSGGLTIERTSGTLRATAIRFTAQLANLQSADQVAGYNVAQRDRIVSSTLSVSRYPDATFTADSVDLPAGVESGGTVSLTVPGQLTIHGVTRSAVVAVQLQVSGGRVEAVGSTSFDMTDFGISPPQVPITSVQPQVTLEFRLDLVPA